MLRWKRVEVELGGRLIEARVADSFLKRALGFMFYCSKERDAILFYGSGCFWMLFVPQDIQLLAVKNGKVVRSIEMKAYSPRQVCVEADFVVELANFPKVEEGTAVKITKGLS